MSFKILVENRSITWVDDKNAMDEFIAAAESEQQIAVDLEADSLHHYRDRVCLIQVSTKNSDWVIDPQANGNLAPLWKLLENPEKVKIFHDADFDLRSLDRDYALRVRNVFDTKVAAELLGWQNLGLSAILNNRFGVKMSKRFQRYAWSRRPVSQDALIYAAMDTRYLRSLRTICEKELIEKERISWATEEFKHLESFRWQPSKRDRLKFWKLGGVRSMNAQQKEALRRFWDIREVEAERRDVPPFKVFGDSDMLDLVQSRSWKASMEFIKNNNRFSSRIVKSMQRALEIAIKIPGREGPAMPEELKSGELPYCKRVFNKMKGNRDINAFENKIDPGIIAGVRIMKCLACLDDDQLSEYLIVKRETGIRYWQWCLLGLSTSEDV